MLADLDLMIEFGSAPGKFPPERRDRFNRGRMKAYAYLAVLAPQPVMDAYDALTDYLLEITNGESGYDWPRMRTLVLAIVNEARKDIGFDASPIEYRGRL